ncbi:GNAT family N-acetyltransferase [Streptomyces sp. NBC_01387]|uniref:GNAT family N-acetyltransferase n=1 Tax=unclassified Streptomyces TaxID=2593676 RepID=UPI002023EEE9|nr:MULTISPECIES: GNAT family N-acetyltransferase [unclassified Streptomyces]MCX4553685.1 GNAT family N-acetyltransferase [Streptomyces sp. NBC_01500]WSC18613.1 GNAT family N-acetyltransferase [Streptomyces sp. NBC_01766]WSV52647.1 GNAT family N-acetyltransferase [Streptomyces sp. NBC_01014]
MTLNYFREDGLLVLDAGRLRLREQSPAAAAVLAEGGTAGLDWLDGSPGSGTQIAAKMVAMATEAGAFLPGWGLYVIERTTDGAALGGIGFHGPPSDGSVEIGYDLTESARGAGWATDAVVALAHWSLELPGVHTVLATTDPGNLPSQRVLTRAGFTRRADLDGLWAYELTGH